jgi:hypothetical protein
VNKIVDRIRKLIELSKHNNSPEEAAQAAAMAQDLMFKYQIGEADIDVSTGERETEEVVDTDVHVEQKGVRDAWKASLANGLAKSFGSKVYTWRTGTTCEYRCVGLKSVTQTVAYMFGYLSLEVERLANEAWNREKNLGAYDTARTWKNSFRLGAVATIVARLNEQRKAQEAEVDAMIAEAKVRADRSKGTALALYKTDQERQDEGYKKVAKERKLRTARTSYTHSHSAYERGQNAGQKVALSTNGKGLGAKATQIR